MKARYMAAALAAALLLGGAACDDQSASAAPRRGGAQTTHAPEAVTYERAIEIENRRHIKNLKDIRMFYRMHKPMRIRETQREYEAHAKRVEEIKKRYGVL